MTKLRLLLLLSCVGLSPACIEVPPLEGPPVEKPPADPDADFTFTVVPAQEQVLPGGSLDCGVRLAWTQATGGDVTWNLVSPPAGIELQPFTLSAGETRGTLRIRIGGGTAPGSYSLTLQGRSGSVTKQVTLAVTVGKPGDLVVNWVVPTPGKAYTRGPLLLQFTVEGGAADAVEILKGSSVLVKPTGSPYSFTWDTTQEAEGSYELSIRATRGGVLFASAPRTVIVDRTAPIVTTYLPASNAATVGVHDAIQVTFSEPMNPHSVTEAAVGLKTGAGIAISKSVALSVDGKTLTVTPRNPLVAPDTVSVDLAALVGTLTDLAGNGVPTAPAWTFTVPTWLPLGGAISAVEGKTSAEDVVLKMDRNDQPVIAWTESDGVAKNIYVARWTGTTWVMLGGGLSGSSGLGTDAANPSIAINSNNQPLVAWDEATGNGMGRIIFTRQWTGSTWDTLPALPLVSSQEQYSQQPQITFDQENNIIIHALDSDPNNSTVRGFKFSPPNSTWIDLHPAQPSSHFHAGSIATARSGPSIFTAYTAYDDATSKRSVAVLPNDAAPLGGTTFGVFAGALSMDVDATLRPWVSWVQSESIDANTDGAVYWSHWEGSKWTSPAIISPTSTGNNTPSIALGTGTPHILAWSGVTGTERSILISQWLGSSWTPLGSPLSALSSAGTPAYGPSVSMDAHGQPLVAWTEADSTSASVYVFHFNY
ncbi:hypothetical protein FOF48_29725 [Corallococcus sp. Z5C101001]|nr:hypothetical protein FOF48_29725 [Corallococcus sp. Z5C101001]